MAKDRIEIEVIAKGLEKVQNDIKELQKSTKKMKSTSDSGLSSLKTGWIKVAAAVTTAVIGIKKAFDLSNEFLRFQQGVQAMERQFGVSANKIIKKLKEVSSGTISNADIIQSANRAMALNVTKDVDKMANLLEVARIRGQAMGVDTNQAFNDIVTGIGRASPLILDNLGIITKGWADEAKAAGQAFDAQFILNKVLEDGNKIIEKSGGIVLTNAEKIQKMKAGFEDTKLILGKLISTEMVKMVDKLDDLAGGTDKINILTRAFRTLSFVISLAIAPFRLLASIIIAVISPAIGLFKAFSEQISNLGAAFQKLTQGDIAGAFKALKSAGKNAFDDMDNKIETFKKSMGGAFTFAKKNAKGALTGISDSFTSIFGKVDQLIDDNTKNLAAQLQQQVKNRQEAENRKKQIIAASFDAAKQITNDFFAFGQALMQQELDNRVAMLEQQRDSALEGGPAAELRAMDEADHMKRMENLQAEADQAREKGDEELAAEKEREIKRLQLEADVKKQEAKINAEFDKKVADAKNKAAEKEKKVAIVQSIINTLLGVTKTLATTPFPLNIPMAAIVGTMGAVNTALIAAKPIPKYAQGSPFSPGGTALVGEQGPELVNLPQGSQVIPNQDISNISNNDNKVVNINVQTNDPIEFVNTLRREHGLDVFAEA